MDETLTLKELVDFVRAASQLSGPVLHLYTLIQEHCPGTPTADTQIGPAIIIRLMRSFTDLWLEDPILPQPNHVGHAHPA